MSTLAFIKRKLPEAEAAALVKRTLGIILAEIQPDAVFVFGSAARKELTDQSDIDLLIVMSSDPAIKIARKTIAKVRHRFGIPVDLVWMTLEEYKRRISIGGLAQVVHEEGVLIHGGVE